MENILKLVKSYGESHKCFIQLLIKEKIFLYSDVGSIFQQINGIDKFPLTTEQNKQIVINLLEIINHEIRVLGLCILSVPDETRCNTDFVTLLTDQNYSENLSSICILSIDELTKFQKLLKMMYNKKKDSENGNLIGELKLSTALNARFNNISTLNAQKLLNKLIELNWIVVDNKRNLLRLHIHAIAELSSGLQSEFHLSMCDLCMQSIFLNRLAHMCDCGCIYHARCIQKVLCLPTKCQGQNCQKILTQELVDLFDFNEDLIGQI